LFTKTISLFMPTLSLPAEPGFRAAREAGTSNENRCRNSIRPAEQEQREVRVAHRFVARL
jgi:hypothetical protein